MLPLPDAAAGLDWNHLVDTATKAFQGQYPPSYRVPWVGKILPWVGKILKKSGIRYFSLSNKGDRLFSLPETLPTLSEPILRSYTLQPLSNLRADRSIHECVQ